jgi:hypothetical protein
MNIKITNILTLALAAVVVGGCSQDLSLAERTYAPRAEGALTPLSAPAQKPAGVREVNITDAGEIKFTEPVTGTYLFTIPQNVTNVKTTGPNIAAYQLYLANAKPTDRPLLVIEIGASLASEAEVGGAELKAENSRKYLLNGLAASEWTGKTADGYPFCELIVSHNDKGDKLRALAIARDKDSRQLALDILASIRWEPKKKEN